MCTLSTSGEPRSYHHGDLRQALIRSALEILSQEGAAELSLRGVARRAGVSPMAPYRHFADKSALLTAVAEDGFRRFAERLAAAARGPADPREGLIQQGVAYVRFACEEPSLFQLMMGPSKPSGADMAGVAEAAAAAFAALRDAVARAGFDATAESGMDVAIACWSLVHGLTVLLLAGRLTGSDQAAIGALVARVTRLVTDGLTAVLDRDGQSGGER